MQLQSFIWDQHHCGSKARLSSFCVLLIAAASFYPHEQWFLPVNVSNVHAFCGSLVVKLGMPRKCWVVWSWEGKLIVYPSIWNMKLLLVSLSALSKRCLWLNNYSSLPSCNKEQFNSGKCRTKLCKLTRRILIALLHVAGEGMVAQS